MYVNGDIAGRHTNGDRPRTAGICYSAVILLYKYKHSLNISTIIGMIIFMSVMYKFMVLRVRTVFTISGRLEVTETRTL